jgi:hypothetical protein
MRRIGRLRILVGIAWHIPDERFLASLSRFIEQCEKVYDLEVIRVKDKKLVEAQEEIGTYFVNSRHDYLLMIEDDQWGFERNHLKALLRGNAEVCGMSYYSRHFPYYSTNMRQVEGKSEEGGPLFAGRHEKSGYEECDLVGYGMTLYKKSVFEKLDKPFFRLNKFGGPESYATDIDFCERLKEKGVKLIGCFEYTINHRDVTPENVMELRIAGIRKNREALLKERGVGI